MSSHPLARKMTAALVAIAGLAGCTTVVDAPHPPALDGTHWRLAALPGWAMDRAVPVTLHVDGARAFGSDGCNRYIASITVGQADLRFAGRPAGTLMACPDEVQRRADAYRRALSDVRRYRVRDAGPDRRLELLDAEGRVLAAFAAQSQSLAGMQWDVTAVNDGRGAVVSLVPGTRVTLSFDDQGRVSGSTGCNRFSARYEQSPAGVQIASPASTRMACPRPGVMAQEQAVLRALSAVRSARIEGNAIELRGADGALQLTAQVAAAGG